LEGDFLLERRGEALDFLAGDLDLDLDLDLDFFAGILTNKLKI
jgi:hypothetical protein